MVATPRAFIDEIARDTYRINVAMPPGLIPGGFSYNQYLVVDERPLLFHTGPRKLFGLVCEQIERVLPVSALRYIGFSHVEADECGSLAEFLAAAPQAQPVCSTVAAVVSVADLVDTPARAMEDGDVLELGRHRLRWQATPHLPHGWDCGYLFDETTRALFCGDLFTQPGTGDRALVNDDILGPSEALRREHDDFSYTRRAPVLVEKLAHLRPELLGCMHGSAWAGDGAALLRQLGRALMPSAR
ncbi:MAG: FprA family A-type flavoprotein [Pseudomonadota bacterium]